MKRLYFIDSENVGDNWVALLSATSEDDELLVFYTPKSPHMNYSNIVKLKQSPREVTFIECFQGANALDFQLCSDLGFRISQYKDCEFVIVSNDNGYEAVIKFWNRLNYPVRRIQGNACSKEAFRSPANTLKEPASEDQQIILSSGVSTVLIREPESITPEINIANSKEVKSEDDVQKVYSEESEEPVSDKTETSSSELSMDSDEPIENDLTAAVLPQKEILEEEKTTVLSEINEEPVSGEVLQEPAEESVSEEELSFMAREILYVVGKENLQNLHESLQQLFGAQKGKKFYDAFKSGSENEFLAKHKPLSQKEKYDLYCSVAFALSDGKPGMPSDFPVFVTSAWRKKKNLNSLRSSMQGKYGKELTNTFYSIIKAHVKILDTIE